MLGAAARSAQISCRAISAGTWLGQLYLSCRQRSVQGHMVTVPLQRRLLGQTRPDGGLQAQRPGSCLFCATGSRAARHSSGLSSAQQENRTSSTRRSAAASDGFFSQQPNSSPDAGSAGGSGSAQQDPALFQQPRSLTGKLRYFFLGALSLLSDARQHRVQA